MVGAYASMGSAKVHIDSPKIDSKNGTQSFYCKYRRLELNCLLQKRVEPAKLNSYKYSCYKYVCTETTREYVLLNIMFLNVLLAITVIDDIFMILVFQKSTTGSGLLRTAGLLRTEKLN